MIYVVCHKGLKVNGLVQYKNISSQSQVVIVVIHHSLTILKADDGNKAKKIMLYCANFISEVGRYNV